MIKTRLALNLALAVCCTVPLGYAQSSAPPALEPEWYVPVEDGCRLYVQEIGRGEDIVIVLHGGFGAEHSYLIEAFTNLPTRYRFILYDQRGSLRSPCPETAISVEKHVADLEKLVAEFSSPKLTIVGHSMGSYLAMAYFSQHPEKVSRLILLGAVSPKRPFKAEETALKKYSDEGVAAFLKRPEIQAQREKESLDRRPDQMSAKGRTNSWRITFAAANIYHVDRWRQLRGGQVYYNEKSGLAASKSMPPTYDFMTALSSSTRPISVILGDHDLVDFGAGLWRHWIESIPNGRLDIIKDAGHNAWIDNPVEFRRLMLRALDPGSN